MLAVVNSLPQNVLSPAPLIPGKRHDRSARSVEYASRRSSGGSHQRQLFINNASMSDAGDDAAPVRDAQAARNQAEAPPALPCRGSTRREHPAEIGPGTRLSALPTSGEVQKALGRGREGGRAHGAEPAVLARQGSGGTVEGHGHRHQRSHPPDSRPKKCSPPYRRRSIS